MVSDKTLAIQTNKHLYSRKPDGSWEESEVTVPEEKFVPLPVELPVEKKKKGK